MSESVFVFLFFIPILATMCSIVIWGMWYWVIRGMMWVLDASPLDGIEEPHVRGLSTIFAAITYGVLVVVFTGII